MGRRDYYDDPDAPAANSLVPAASAVVLDEQDRIVLHRRRDNGMWALPGGAMELGESVGECVVRETKEETGLDVEVTGVVGIYSDPKHVFAYDDGEVRQEFSICLLARVRGGSIQASDESHEVGVFDPAEIDALPMVPSIRLRLADHLSCAAPAIR